MAEKLKRIPTDLVAYIQIETEAIRDANDKMIISSYCLHKLEMVNWYIQLLEVGSEKYTVPHSKQYLETIMCQLMACHKKIMDVKITNPKDRPIISIKYPEGYEG
jgi:ribosomal protein S26